MAPQGLTLGSLAAAVDRIAPAALAYDWDNVGLQVGNPAAPVRSILVALEVTDAAIAEARRLKCSAMVTHHPLIFVPEKSLRADRPTGRRVMELVQAGIGLVVAHTNLDCVRNGTNGLIADLLGLHSVEFLEPRSAGPEYKFTVFVPADYTGKILEAIHRGGGGRIGNYTHCTFRSPGTGTYVPGEGANPFAGKVGDLEQAPEDRLECVVPRHALASVLHEVMQAHPYEEVAYDIYPLAESTPRHGLGLGGTLRNPLSVNALAEKLHDICGAQATAIAGNTKPSVRRVAIITGSAGTSIRGISPDRYDTVITGELTYHNTMEALDRGLRVITVGHAASEKIVARRVKELLEADPAVRDSGAAIHTFEDFPDPLRVVATRTTRKG